MLSPWQTDLEYMAALLDPWSMSSRNRCKADVPVIATSKRLIEIVPRLESNHFQKSGSQANRHHTNTFAGLLWTVLPLLKEEIAGDPL